EGRLAEAVARPVSPGSRRRDGRTARAGGETWDAPLESLSCSGEAAIRGLARYRGADGRVHIPLHGNLGRTFTAPEEFFPVRRTLPRACRSGLASTNHAVRGGAAGVGGRSEGWPEDVPGRNGRPGRWPSHGHPGSTRRDRSAPADLPGRSHNAGG